MTAAKSHLNIPDPKGFTPVFTAVYEGHVDVIKALCDLGANIDTPNKDGYTLMFFAAKRGHVGAIRALVRLLFLWLLV